MPRSPGQIGSISPQATSFSFDPTGMPGTETTLTVCNEFADPGDPRNQGGPAGLPGLYKVVFTFSRPGFSRASDRELSCENGIEGDSHLAIAPPAYAPPGQPPITRLRIDCTTEDGPFRCFGIPNSRGFLGKVRFEPFQAAGFLDAAHRAFRAVASALSSITMFLDVPLHVHQTDVTELRTESFALTHAVPAREAPLVALPAEPLPKDFRLYASLYREASNSLSPAYQFLCWFKIIEGLRTRRGRRAAELRQAGQTPPSSPRILVPKTAQEQAAWLKELFPAGHTWDQLTLDSIFRPEVTGRRAEDLVMGPLRALRLKIAHALLDSGEPGVQLDEGHDRDEIQRWLPLLRCLARAYLRTEFPRMFKPHPDAPSFIRESGTPR